MTWILSILKAFWKPVAALLAGAILLWRNRRLKATVERQDAVIKGHQAKEKVHNQDLELESAADTQIDDLRERVSRAESPEQAAQIVGDALNEYFGGKK